MSDTQPRRARSQGRHLADRLNYYLTNLLIPRRTLTRLVGRFSRIESPWLTRVTIAVWQCFVDDLHLDEAHEQRYTSLRNCFTRKLKPGARRFDPDPQVITSPCDAVVGASGAIEAGWVHQVKHSRYSLAELLGSDEAVQRYQAGRYVTLRLKSSMYHRFHAPCDLTVTGVRYIPGDVRNVNPPTLARVPRLFCRNERAVVSLRHPAFGDCLTLVPVGAVLVASIRLTFLNEDRDLRRRDASLIPCMAQLTKGDEMGYFEHGSTIIVLATEAFELVPNLLPGAVIRAGEPLMREAAAPGHPNHAPAQANPRPSHEDAGTTRVADASRDCWPDPG